MKLPETINFKSDDTKVILQETITDNKTKEISGRYLYVNGFYFAGSEIVLPLSQIEKLKGNGLIEI